MEWVTFVSSLDELKPGKEVELILKDLTPERRNYESRRVKAKGCSEGSQGDTLWVRSRTGVRHPQPFSVQILQELPLISTKY